MPIKEGVIRQVPMAQMAPQRQSVEVSFNAQAMLDANTQLVEKLTSALNRLTSARKRVTVSIVDRDRNGRISKAVFDVQTVKE